MSVALAILAAVIRLKGLRQVQQNRSIASAKPVPLKEKEPSTNSRVLAITEEQVSESAKKRLDVDASELNKSAKHQTTMQLSDKGFSALVAGNFVYLTFANSSRHSAMDWRNPVTGR
ncbi:hypothetical protein [Methylotuvimicrobium sp. KM1]|uniref:hypothetical protein n=1 Tax=Methylotuvimicrobium sp. KM1 TaxID=3377707 RepID=UPI00384EB5C9